MRVLFCPTHYVYDDAREGSELSWAYNIADRVGSLFPISVVVTGRSTVGPRNYRIVELTPAEKGVNFGLTHAFAFNARYTLAAFRELHHGRFDVVHHVLPFSLGRTYNFAALRHGSAIPFVIGPVQPSLAVRDGDLDPADFKRHVSRRQTALASARRSAAHAVEVFVADVVAPLAFGGLSGKTLIRAAAVVAVNDEARGRLVAGGLSPSRVVIIPPGVDTKRFGPVPRDATGATGVVVLSVSQLIKRKNVDVIIRAFANVARAVPNIRLQIVGDGPEREELTRLAHTLGVQEKVTFTGFVPNAEVHEEYQRADVFVNASAAEGFATTCLEALASGLPVVSTRVGGFVDAVEDHQNGYLLGAANAEELAATLGRLAQNPTLIATLSRRARDLAKRKFDWDTAVIPSYLDVYERVTGQNSTRTEDVA